MSFIGWVAVIGGLLLTMALSSTVLRRSPISTAAVYLAFGCIIGPWGLKLLHLDLREGTLLFERLTEGAVVLSLFIGGLRLRLPLSDPTWRAAGRLAVPVMLASIAGVAAAGYFTLGLSLGAALLLGAILAPTDPVLAGAVKVNHSQDHDRVRYALSGEAGLNDGAAFPFVVLGLAILASGYDSVEFGAWAARRIVWAIPAGLLLGFVLGAMVGRAAIAIRAHQRDTAAPTDFLALALVALAYSAAEFIGAWGFLSVFAAGLGLRHAEVSVVAATPHPDMRHADSEQHPPAETMVSPNVVTKSEISEPAVAAGVLVAEVFSFGDTVERLLEVLLVVLVGVALASHWDARAVPLAALLFVVIRPLASMILLVGTPTTYFQRGLLGWFGIRGIGSLYYLAYSLNHGLMGNVSHVLSDLTLSVIALSVVAHGLSARPLLDDTNNGYGITIRRHQFLLAITRSPSSANGAKRAIIRHDLSAPSHSSAASQSFCGVKFKLSVQFEHGENIMSNQDQSKSFRGYNSTIRKQRHWPPASAPAPSTASKLRQRQPWQPQAWQKVHFL